MRCLEDLELRALAAVPQSLRFEPLDRRGDLPVKEPTRAQLLGERLEVGRGMTPARTRAAG